MASITTPQAVLAFELLEYVQFSAINTKTSCSRHNGDGIQRLMKDLACCSTSGLLLHGKLDKNRQES
jgi:hypothetical protein